MKFLNKTSDDRQLPALGQVAEAGKEFVVTADEAAGLVGQCVGDGAWLEPADDDAKAAVADYEAVEEALAATEPPDESASKAEWVAWAEAHGDADAASKTKKDLVAEHGASIGESA